MSLDAAASVPQPTIWDAKQIAMVRSLCAPSEQFPNGIIYQLPWSQLRPLLDLAERGLAVTPERCLILTQEALAQGERDERAAIVAWLRKDHPEWAAELLYYTPSLADLIESYGDKIERDEHEVKPK